MKQLNLALAALALASGSACAKADLQPADTLGDDSSRWATGQVGTDKWRLGTDFATASGRPPPPAWSALGSEQFGAMPEAPLEPGSEDPLAQPPNPAGEALADNIAVENNAVDGFISVPAVPEPSAWLMMLAGMGAIGVVIWRRRDQER